MHTSRGPASIIGRLMGPWDNRAGLPEGQEPQHRRARDEFGATVWARRGAAAFVSAAESAGSGAAAAALNAAGGLLIVRGLGGIVDEPSLMSRCVQTTGEGLSSVQDCIRNCCTTRPHWKRHRPSSSLPSVFPAPPPACVQVRLAVLFGPQLDDHTALKGNQWDPEQVHPGNRFILVVANRGPNSITASGLPPSVGVTPMPVPDRRADGGVPITWPHRTGWHTDQSYRRPPPDVSLLFAAKPVPLAAGGQTLFSDATGAYEALPVGCANCIALPVVVVAPAACFHARAVVSAKTDMQVACRRRL